MKHLFKLTLTMAFLTSCLSLSAEQLLIAGSGWAKVAIIEKESREVLWEYPLEKGWECNNAVALKNGDVLFSYKKGAKVVTTDNQEVWDIKAPEGCEMQSAKLLKNGNCLIAWCGHPLTIMEVKASTGEILSKTEYDSGVQNAHGQMRQINKMDDGNYIVPIVSQTEIHIVSPEGKLVRKIDVEGKPFATEQIKGSRYLAAGGDSHVLCEVDLATGEIYRVIKDEDIKDSPLFFAGGIECNKKSFYLCSWQGHSKGKTGPKVLELDADLNVIWKIETEDEGIGRVSSVCSIKYKKKK
ncbi:MAG: hypothetical protein SNG02_05135 [Rikenellaceae bacterium]